MTYTDYPYMCRVQSDGALPCDIPTVPLEISFNGKGLKTSGLVDSGCTLTHVNEAIALALGLELAACKEAPTTGISGSAVGHLAMASILIDGHGEAFESRVLLVKDLPVAVLLGQDNFFEKFNVKFEKSKGTFAIERIS